MKYFQEIKIPLRLIFTLRIEKHQYFNNSTKVSLN